MKIKKTFIFSLFILSFVSANAFSAWVHKVESVDTTNYSDSANSIALDQNNNPSIAYYDQTNKILKFAKKSGSSWQTYTVDNTTASGTFLSLKFDSNNNAHIAYNFFVGTDTINSLQYASCSGTVWSTSTVDASVDILGEYASLAFDKSNIPHIAYRAASDDTLKYATLSGVTWSTSTVATNVLLNGNCSIAINPLTNLPSIAFFDATNYMLKFADFSGSAWTITTIDSGGTPGQYNSLVFNSSGIPSVSYYIFVTGDLKYATLKNGVWEKEIVETEGTIGTYTSLALDSNGNPQISYRDETEGFLKHASKRDGSSWFIENISLGASQTTGNFTSLVIDSQNFAHISYNNHDSGELGYALVYWQLDLSPSNDDAAVYHPIFIASKGEKASIKLNLSAQNRVQINIYDFLGKKIKAIADEDIDAGITSYEWNALDDNGASVASGVYVVVINIGLKNFKKKIVVIN